MITVEAIRTLKELVADSNARFRILTQLHPGTLEQDLEARYCLEMARRASLCCTTLGINLPTLQLWDSMPDEWLSLILADALKKNARIKTRLRAGSDEVTVGRALQESAQLQSIVGGVFARACDSMRSKPLNDLTLGAVVAELRLMRRRMDKIRSWLATQTWLAEWSVTRKEGVLVEFREEVETIVFRYANGLLQELAAQACLALGFSHSLLADLLDAPDCCAEIEPFLKAHASNVGLQTGKDPGDIELELMHYCVTSADAVDIVVYCLDKCDCNVPRVSISEEELQALLN